MVSSIAQRITDRLVEGNSSHGRVNIGQLDITKRLNAYLSDSETKVKSSEAASFVSKPEPPPPPVTYQRSKPAQIKEVKEVAATEIDPNEEVAPERGPTFAPGKELFGLYRSGHFITDSRQRGTYEQMSGGQMSFNIGGYKGIVMPNNTAVAFNSETGASYSMDVKFSGGKFTISNIQELSQKPYEAGDAKPLYIEGRSQNVAVRYNKDSGNIGISYPGADGQLVTGTGYMDPDGTMVLALSNGSTIKAHYDFSENGKLRIYSRSMIG